VYILNRDNASRLTISSPLEAHKTHTICYSIVGLDVGFENPVFASLEVDYEDDEMKKNLVYYELDLGLNHCVRKWSDTVHTGVTNPTHISPTLPLSLF
jgi:splicing factor 3B subunit 3